MKKITVVELMDISTLPPVQNLIRILLSEGHKINVIGKNLISLTDDILKHPNYHGYEISYSDEAYRPIGLMDKLRAHTSIRKLVDECMKNSDILWTTSMETSKALYRSVLKYKNIMQLMELQEYATTFHGHVKIPMDDIARHSWKVVCAEINRAYIQQVWWDLQKKPVVMPNKPYSLDYGKTSPAVDVVIKKMKEEKRKIVVYFGAFGVDRDLIPFARSIQKSDDYVLYIAGRALGEEGMKQLSILREKYGVEYMGFFNPPLHLALVKYAYIGILPYMAKKSDPNSSINALYCAPNKIWEYAGFGVPMVGSDVLGLRLPFEQWNIGVCCDMNNESSIIDAIKYVDENRNEMSANCHKFYDSVDLNQIVSDILEEDV